MDLNRKTAQPTVVDERIDFALLLSQTQ